MSRLLRSSHISFGDYLNLFSIDFKFLHTRWPMAKDDGEVKENIENLKGLGCGDDKKVRFLSLAQANYVEGYDWGSVWFYKIRKGGSEGTLANKDIEQRYMPVAFDNTGTG